MTPTEPTVSRQRRYQLRHKALGLCEYCSQRVVTSGRCERHRRGHNARQKAMMKQRREARP